MTCQQVQQVVTRHADFHADSCLGMPVLVLLARPGPAEAATAYGLMLDETVSAYQQQQTVTEGFKLYLNCLHALQAAATHMPGGLLRLHVDSAAAS